MSCPRRFNHGISSFYTSNVLRLCAGPAFDACHTNLHYFRSTIASWARDVALADGSGIVIPAAWLNTQHAHLWTIRFVSGINGLAPAQIPLSIFLERVFPEVRLHRHVMSSGVRWPTLVPFTEHEPHDTSHASSLPISVLWTQERFQQPDIAASSVQACQKAVWLLPHGSAQIPLSRLASQLPTVPSGAGNIHYAWLSPSP